MFKITDNHMTVWKSCGQPSNQKFEQSHFMALASIVSVYFYLLYVKKIYSTCYSCTDVCISFSYLSFLCSSANSFILSQSLVGSSTLGI